jgi:hypothetical protein
MLLSSDIKPGHYERKMKHLENQKESKKKMKRIGRVDLPQEAFFVSLFSAIIRSNTNGALGCAQKGVATTTAAFS